MPNCGHAVGGRPQALSSLAAFARAVAAGLPLPTVTPCSAEEPGGLALQVGSDPAPVAAKLWVATSPARDFREAEWRPAGLACSDGRWRAQIARPGSGYVATYAQLTFTVAGIPLHTTTPARVVAGAPTG
ncbi:MAG: PhoPQ-activated protein PqaA family protein [Candidatus Bipolaricaulaceae bacterium]